MESVEDPLCTVPAQVLENPPPIDTLTFFTYTQSLLTACPDTLEVAPIGVVNAFNCGINSGATFSISTTNGLCIDYLTSGNTTTSSAKDTVCVEVCSSVVPTWCDTTVMIFTVATPPPPTANVDMYSVLENDTTVINPLANDNAPGNPNIIIVSGPENGEVIVDNATDLVVYIPDTNFCGQDSILYTVCNGQCADSWIYIDVVCDGIEGNYKIYNSFSPNGDGLNDFFVIQGIEGVDNYKLSIFNRWGIEVFSATDESNTNMIPEQLWDGTWNGNNVPDGTYFYTFEDLDNKTVDKGFVQIYR